MNMKRMQNFTSGVLRRKLGSAVLVLAAWGLMSTVAAGSTPTQAAPVQEPTQSPTQSQTQPPAQPPAQQAPPQPAPPPAQQAPPQPAPPPAQQAPPQPSPPPAQQAPPQPAPPPAQPAPPQPAQPPAQPAPPQPAPPPAAGQRRAGARISLHLENANLLQVIGIIAAELKMNYVVDPRGEGAW